ncbi:MAG: DUF362 domain-containing protein [Polyangiaceae bacterium]
MSTPPNISRRAAALRIAAAAGTVAGAAGVGWLRYDRGGFDEAHKEGERQVRDFRLGSSDAPDMAIAAPAAGDLSADDKDPAALTRRAVDGVGGMKRFVSRGDVVVIKPNIGWDRAPVHAANSNPKVVAELVRQAYDAGAKTVIVTDASCNEPGRCFQRSGIWAAAYEVGADVRLPNEAKFRSMRMRGEVLDEWPIYTTLINADKVINVPVAKHHNLAGYTGAMKNWYGMLGGRRNRLHQNIDVSVADLATFMQPTLTVLDATRVLLRNGPQGGNLADAKDMHTVVASIDQVAADAFGCTLIGKTPQQIPYLAMGEARGLGVVDWQKLRYVSV